MTCFVCLHSLYARQRYIRAFHVDERRFTDAVSTAISNLLENYIAPTNAATQTTVFDSTFERRVPGLGFYTDLRGQPHALHDGIEYSRGDFSPFGIIVSISDDRYIARQGSTNYIVRGSAVRPAAREERTERTAQAVRPGASPDGSGI